MLEPPNRILQQHRTRKLVNPKSLEVAEFSALARSLLFRRAEQALG